MYEYLVCVGITDLLYCTLLCFAILYILPTPRYGIRLESTRRVYILKITIYRAVSLGPPSTQIHVSR